jgi:3-oxoadipate enol-lactonase/4-carboxymuconolactone decarboxylase
MNTRTPYHRAEGPADAPALLLGPSLGTAGTLWAAQAPALSRSRRVISWDLPGHGGTPSSVLPDPAPGRTTVADLAGLVLALADDLGLERFDYAGVSLGGAVGAWLAVHHPERISSLALLCSSARFGEPGGWHERAALVREQGTGVLTGTALQRWFTPAGAGSEVAKRLLAGLPEVDDTGYAACCDALAGYDLRADLHRISVPTLILAGREDQGTPVAHARELADGIPGASLVEIAAAAHLALAEQPQAVLGALLGHLGDRAGQERTAGYRRTAVERGEAMRRAVLGDAHVDRAAARTTGFTADFQDLITRYAWGEIWTRPGLDRRTRSVVTLTALVALGHHEELALHVRAALGNGLSRDEIGEVLLQCAVYCGVPAANSAFAVAQRVLAGIDSTSTEPC